MMNFEKCSKELFSKSALYLKTPISYVYKTLINLYYIFPLL